MSFGAVSVMNNGLVLGRIAFLLGLFLSDTVLAASVGSNTLNAMRARGFVRCNIPPAPDRPAAALNLLTDMCRAVAISALGRPSAVSVTHRPATEEIQALKAGDIDLSLTTDGWSLTQSAGQQMDFAPPVLYDGLGVAGWDGKTPDRVIAIPEASFCVAQGDRLALELYALAAARAWTLRSYARTDLAIQGFLARECSFVAADRLSLIQVFAGQHGSVKLFPDLITRRPVVPMVSGTDAAWASLVRWTVFALILAEDKRLTAEDATRLIKTSDAESVRMLGGLPQAAADLGLPPNWAARLISQIGNYGEIFERHYGSFPQLRQIRGPNQPWSKGGLMYAPVFQ